MDYKKVWMRDRGIRNMEDSCCEVVGCYRYVDEVHHIEPRGMGGTRKPPDPKKLIGLCRTHHEQAEGLRGEKFTKEKLMWFVEISKIEMGKFRNG